MLDANNLFIKYTFKIMELAKHKTVKPCNFNLDSGKESNGFLSWCLDFLIIYKEYILKCIHLENLEYI